MQWVMPRPKEEAVCQICERPYMREVRANSRYCSRKCYYTSRVGRTRWTTTSEGYGPPVLPNRTAAEVLQVAWAAGFFDGEGCVSISRSRKGGSRFYYTLGATAYQKVKPPIDLLQGLFGGAVRQRNDGGWLWDIKSQPLINALAEMLPYLIVKKPQAELAIEFQQRKVRPGGKYADSDDAHARMDIDYCTMRALKGVQ